jgi:hypothetical protein
MWKNRNYCSLLAAMSKLYIKKRLKQYFDEFNLISFGVLFQSLIEDGKKEF